MTPAVLRKSLRKYFGPLSGGDRPQRRTQSTDHSNNEPTFCRVRIFVEFELAAFDRCVLISSSGPPFEDEQQSLS